MEGFYRAQSAPEKFFQPDPLVGSKENARKAHIVAMIVSPRSPPPLPESMDEFIGQLQPQAASAWATTPQCGYWAGSANA